MINKKNPQNSSLWSLRDSIFVQAVNACDQLNSLQKSNSLSISTPKKIQPSNPSKTDDKSSLPSSSSSFAPSSLQATDKTTSNASNTKKSSSRLVQSQIMTKSQQSHHKRIFNEAFNGHDNTMVLGTVKNEGIEFLLPSKRSKFRDSFSSPGNNIIHTSFSKMIGNVGLETEEDIKSFDDDSESNLSENELEQSFCFSDDVENLFERHQNHKSQLLSSLDSYQYPNNDKLPENPESLIDQDQKTDQKSTGDFILSESGKLPIVRIVSEVNEKLFDYQREGIKFLYNLYISKRGGILADEMGLGKTVQTIVFIMSIKSSVSSFHNNITPFLKSKHTLKSKDSNLNGEKYEEASKIEIELEKKIFAPVCKNPILIVCPASLLQHWHREFYVWTKLRVFIAHGKDKDTVLATTRQNNLDVALISYDSLISSASQLNDIRLSMIIFDEVHKVKNKLSKLYQVILRLKVDRKYGLTGTVMQNSFEELWTVCNILGCATSTLGDLDYFKKHYIIPIKEGHVSDASTSQISRSLIVAQSLVEKLKKFILRRTKQTIKHQLPPKEDHIVFCSLTELQLRIYKRIVDSPLYKILRRNSIQCKCNSKKAFVKCCGKYNAAIFGNSNQAFKNVALPALTRLQQLANHVALLLPNEILNQAKMILNEKKMLARKRIKIGSNNQTDMKKKIISIRNDDHDHHDKLKKDKNDAKRSFLDQKNSSLMTSSLITSFFKKEQNNNNDNNDKDHKMNNIENVDDADDKNDDYCIIEEDDDHQSESNQCHQNQSDQVDYLFKIDRDTRSQLDELVKSPFLKLALGDDFDYFFELLLNGDAEMEMCGKLRVLASLLPVWKAEGSKVLLFSSSTRLMDILERFCCKHSYSYGRIDGTTAIQQRQRIVDIFNKSKTQFVFIVSTKACGVGLNLSSANIVVIFEPHFNVTLDMQASDRAHRIGQQRTTRVYRLVSAYTIEELTYRRQIYKQQIANIATEGKVEKRFFKNEEVFGAHLLFSLLDNSQLNTVDIIEREATNLTKKTQNGFVESSFVIQKDQNRNEENNKQDALFNLIMKRAQNDVEEAEDDLFSATTTTTNNSNISSPSHSHHQSSSMTSKFDDTTTNQANGFLANNFDDSDQTSLDEILRKAGVLHSHLNSELFTNESNDAVLINSRMSLGENEKNSFYPKGRPSILPSEYIPSNPKGNNDECINLDDESEPFPEMSQ